MADMNARHRLFGHNDNNRTGKQLASIIQNRHLTRQGPDFPTYTNDRGTGRPDIVLTTSNFPFNLHLKPGPMTPSDHIPIIATVSAEPIHIAINPRRQNHNANWNKFKILLQNQEIILNPHATTQDIDKYVTTWTDAIVDASNQSIPTIYKRQIPGVKPNQTIYQLQKQHADLIQNITITGPNRQKYNQLESIRKQLNIEYKRLYSETWDQIIENLNKTTDPTKFWKTIKRLQGNDQQRPPYIKDNDGNKLYTDNDREPLFRSHWSGIFSDNGTMDNDHTKTIDETIGRCGDTLKPFPTANTNRLDKDCPPISKTEFYTTIQSLKNKAPGPSNITTEIIKHLPTNMLNCLKNIFNLTLSIGYFPDQFKQAIMIFLPKGKSSIHQVTNYRPISLLEIPGKILDKILNRRLQDQLTIKSKINKRQHGFRSHRGTHTALARLHETISRDTKTGHKIDIVLRDVSKAFDKVWHNGLKYKIATIDLHVCFTKTLCSFLDNRTATIRLGQHKGQTFRLHTGVPQGACLSPTLYTFYTHDLPEPTSHAEYIAFADDITQIISYPGQSHRMIAKLTQRAIESINQYETKWKIKTNTSKFTIIPINRLKTTPVTIDNTQIQYKSEGTCLGLRIGTHGYSHQISQRRAIAHRRLNKLNRFKNLSQKNKRHLYIATVSSAMLYPCIPLHVASKNSLRKLQTIQNRATRFITGKTKIDRITSKQLHKDCSLEPINIILHNRAQKAWQNMETQYPEIYTQFPDTDTSDTIRFPSSKRQALSPEPAPLYT